MLEKVLTPKHIPLRYTGIFLRQPRAEGQLHTGWWDGIFCTIILYGAYRVYELSEKVYTEITLTIFLFGV